MYIEWMKIDVVVVERVSWRCLVAFSRLSNYLSRRSSWVVSRGNNYPYFGHNLFVSIIKYTSI